MATCYRHPNVETGVSCSSCGRPICPDCMTTTPVGMRCPECATEKTRVRSGAAATSQVGGYPATIALIAINVVVFLAEMATGSGGLSSTTSDLIGDFGLRGAQVADGEWYRLVTSGFLHAGFMHIAFNMIALYFLGRVLEPSIGTVRFLMVYFASLLAGSFGAILLSDNLALTVGASGAVFGLFAATFIIAYGRGLGHVANEIGVIIGINLLLTFTISGISIGGHIGGLIGGALCGLLVIAGERGYFGSNARLFEYGGMIAIGAVSVFAALSAAEPVHGIQFALVSLPF
ncbi:MAG: rhomboid family intramembrane serine protease [Solirubrobacterales bacterium]|nr:rhomboid family intramembrane serine protease [Solirubrobacterales bacterium]